MNNLFSFDLSKDSSAEQVKAIACEYWAIVKSQYTQKRSQYLGNSIAFWVIPVITLYFFGLALAWVYDGFKNGNNK